MCSLDEWNAVMSDDVKMMLAVVHSSYFFRTPSLLEVNVVER